MPDQEYLLLLVIIVIMLFLRVRRQSRGMKANTVSIFRYPAIYILISILLVLSSFNILLLLYVIIAMILGYALGSILGKNSSVFASNGKILYKRSKEVSAIWAAAFVIRILIEFAFPITYTGFGLTVQNAFSGVYLWYSIIDLLLGASAGMLLGEALHLYKKYNAIKAESHAQ